jgi:hypothetical protein
MPIKRAEVCREHTPNTYKHECKECQALDKAEPIEMPEPTPMMEEDEIIRLNETIASYQTQIFNAKIDIEELRKRNRKLEEQVAWLERENGKKTED